MRLLTLMALVCGLGCTYNVTDDKRLDDIVQRQNAIESRQEALENRISTQADQINTLRRLGVYK